jgi:hypothetical protein
MRDADEQNAAGCEEQNFEGDNSGQHRQCIVVERPLGGGRSGAFGESSWLTKTRITFDWLRALKLNQWLIAGAANNCRATPASCDCR